MFQVDLQAYVYALSCVMIASIFAIIVVIHNLNKAAVSVVSLRKYGLFFLLGLIGWVGLAFKDATNVQMDLTLPVLFFIICSFILLLALKECTECDLAVFIVGVMHLLAVFANIMMNNDFDRMILLSVYALVVYPLVLFFAYASAKNNKNIGSVIIGFSAFIILCGLPLQFYGIYVSQNPHFVYGVALVTSSSGFILVGIGFLTSVIISEHQQLTKQALNDPLTGLYNRRGLDYSLSVTLNSAQRLGKCISVIELDIDYFKKVNDTYGHDCGDYVLQELSKKLMDSARSMDVCCRLGGEEFVIALVDIKLDKAIEIAERIRKKIESLELVFDNKVIQVTASFGVASHCNDIDLRTLIKLADKALYNAKAEGRNKVCFET